LTPSSLIIDSYILNMSILMWHNKGEFFIPLVIILKGIELIDSLPLPIWFNRL